MFLHNITNHTDYAIKLDVREVISFYSYFFYEWGRFGLNIFYLYTLYIEQHIKTYINIQYTNGIQKKVFRLIRICIPFKISILLILSRFREKTISVPMLNLYYESLETFQLEVI